MRFTQNRTALSLARKYSAHIKPLASKAIKCTIVFDPQLQGKGSIETEGPVIAASVNGELVASIEYAKGEKPVRKVVTEDITKRLGPGFNAIEVKGGLMRIKTPIGSINSVAEFVLRANQTLVETKSYRTRLPINAFTDVWIAFVG